MIEVNATVDDIHCKPDDEPNIVLEDIVPDVIVSDEMVDDAEKLFVVDPEGSFAVEVIGVP